MKHPFRVTLTFLLLLCAAYSAGAAAAQRGTGATRLRDPFVPPVIPFEFKLKP